MEPIGARIKEARQAMAVTLDQLADDIGYHVSTINNVENGHDQPSKRLRLRLIEVLNLNPVWLDTGEGEMFTAEHLAAHKIVGKQLGIIDGHDARIAKLDPDAGDEIWLEPILRGTREIMATLEKLLPVAEAMKDVPKALAKLKTHEKNFEALLARAMERKRAKKRSENGHVGKG